MEAAERRQPLWARERTLREVGSVRQKVAVSREALILGNGNGPRGSGTAKHPTLLDALHRTVHAGGGQGWESDHLEPFLFCLPAQFERASTVTALLSIRNARLRSI